MGTTFTSRALVLIALGFLQPGWAFTLGPLSGQAVLGKPLNVSVPLSGDGKVTAGNCITVQVAYGETALPAHAVKVDFEFGPAQTGGWAHIATTAPINEPVVTVFVHARCGRDASRQFVLLPDAPDSLPVPVAAAGPAFVAKRVNAVALRAPLPLRQTISVVTVARPDQWLRVSPQLLSIPAEPESAVAASMWKAASARPQDLLLMSSRLSQLESEMGTLHALSGRDGAEVDSHLASLRQLRQVHRSDGLAALVVLIASSAGLTILWARARTRKVAVPLTAAWAQYLAPLPRKAARRDALAPSPSLAETPRQVDVSVPTALLGAPPDAEAAGLVDAQALVDTRQQAEFFLSLDQPEEAITLLEVVLNTHQPPLLAYLELLDIHHRGQQWKVLETLKERFRHDFHLEPPSVGAGRADSAWDGIDAYPDVAQRIAQAWPYDSSALTVIEEILLACPKVQGDVLSLQACRDLAWLYRLRQEIARPEGPASELPWDWGEEMQSAVQPMAEPGPLPLPPVPSPPRPLPVLVEDVWSLAPLSFARD